MGTKKIMKYLMAVAVIGIVITSCKKKEDVKDSDTSAASDNALAEGAYNDVHNIADEAAGGSVISYLATTNPQEKGLLSTCSTVVIDTTVTPHTITINFGT